MAAVAFVGEVEESGSDFDGRLPTKFPDGPIFFNGRLSKTQMQPETNCEWGRHGSGSEIVLRQRLRMAFPK